MDFYNNISKCCHCLSVYSCDSYSAFTEPDFRLYFSIFSEGPTETFYGNCLFFHSFLVQFSYLTISRELLFLLSHLTPTY